MAAKKKPLVVKTAGGARRSVGEPAIVRESLELPPARPAGRILTGDAGEAAASWRALLRDEAKVI